MDERRRRIDGLVTTVGEVAAAEPTLDIPVRPFPAELEVERTVSSQSLVQFDDRVSPHVAVGRARRRPSERRPPGRHPHRLARA
ncbi:hypothetical protein ACWGJ7_41435, partial [Streptomyces tendae]